MNVISLSSIPPRFELLGPTLESLLEQSAPIDRIILNVARKYRRFPDHDGRLPDVPDGVEVVVVEKDLGPATKVLPTVKAYQGQDVNILFCDDEWIYLPDWAEKLLAAARAHPGCAITFSCLNAAEHGADGYVPSRTPWVVDSPRERDIEYRLKRILSQLDFLNLFTSPYKPARRLVKRSGYTDIFEGFAGVLVRPEFFDEAVFDIPDRLWAVDDVWLSGHVARKGVPVWAVSDYACRETRVTDHAALHSAEIDGLRRKEANAACIRYFQEKYGVWT